LSKYVIAVEPDPVARNILDTHRRINGLKTVEIVPEAIVGYHKFDFMSSDIPGNSKSMFTTSIGDNAWEVDNHTLPELIDRFRVYQPSIIKIDVEGAEVDILNYSSSWIQKYKPTLHLSTHRSLYHNPNESIETLWSVISTYRSIFNAQRKFVTFKDFARMGGVDTFLVTDE
jgi:FkbM family methyltransferase